MPEPGAGDAAQVPGDVRREQCGAPVGPPLGVRRAALPEGGEKTRPQEAPCGPIDTSHGSQDLANAGAGPPVCLVTFTRNCP